MAKDLRIVLSEFTPLPCDASIQVRQLVYWDKVESKLKIADHSDPIKGFAIGMVYTKLDSVTCTILKRGPISGFSGLDTTKNFWGNDTGTPGSVQTTVPSKGIKNGHVIQFIGYAIDSETLYLNIDLDPIII